MTGAQAPAAVRGLVRPILTDAAERMLLVAASRIRVGCLDVTLPDGRRRTFGDPASPERGEVVIHDPEAYIRIVVGGETGAGEAYVDGLWSSPDPTAVIRVGA